MATLPQDAHRVNLKLPSHTPGTIAGIPYDEIERLPVLKWYKHHDDIAKRDVTLAALRTHGIAQNNRTRGGKMYATESLYMREDLADQLLADGATIFVIKIEYKRSGRTLFYSASISTIKELGNREYLYGCWQWGLPVRYWSVNGQEPEAAQPEPEPAPVAEQPALFDFAEAEPARVGWRGGY